MDAGTVHLKHIFHLGDEASIGLAGRARYAPLLLLLPRLKFVFLSVSCTAWSEIVFMYCSSTILSASASSCNVHLDLPCGGVEQGSMTSLASTSPVMQDGRPGRGLSYNALCKPSVRNSRRILCTVEGLVSRACTTSASLLPSLLNSTTVYVLWSVHGQQRCLC